MKTCFIKNFDKSDFQKLCEKFTCLSRANVPHWKGTIYVGNQPLYIECRIKWLADKINDYFVHADENIHIDNTKELYILNSGTDNFIDHELSAFSDLFFLGDDIFTKPDLIANKDYIFLRNSNRFFISLSETNPRNILYLDETHLLARLFYYIFDSNETIVLHGAVVAYGDYGILITGVSGTGKSTLSAYCLANGLRFVGDDKIALHKKDGILYAAPIYSMISLESKIDTIKTIKTSTQNDSNKNIYILDKSQISNDVPVRAILEIHKAGSQNPDINPLALSPIITRICNDYSVYSVLVQNKNPLIDYNNIFALFFGIDSYKLNLSKSLPENIEKLIDFVKFRRL